jgi:RNA polymerase sigma-70 factor, ECF subfamily
LAEYAKISALSVRPGADQIRTDIALLNRVIDREPDALAALYDAHSRLLFGLILHILKNRDEAEEILQEVFVQVWTRANTYQPSSGSPVGWLVGIARNRAIDRLRANGVRSRVVDPTITASTLDAPDRHAPFGEQQIAVRRALDALPHEQRDLIEQAYFQGFTHSELAARCNLPLGTVKTRIRGAMQTLRGQLDATLMEQ